MSTVLRWKEVASLSSDRAAFKGKQVRAFAIDDLTGEQLECITFSPDEKRLGYCLWVKDFATCINDKAQYMRAGTEGDSGVFETHASSYKNKIHAVTKGIHVFTTTLHQENWVEAVTISATQDLTMGQAVEVKVYNEATGKAYESLTFTPTKDRLKAAQWRQDLAKEINKESVFLKAGRLYSDTEVDKEKIKTSGHDLFYPSAGENKIWIPKGSDLKVSCDIRAWRDIGNIRSDRAAMTGQKVIVYVIDEVTDEELERIIFSPSSKSAGQTQWPKECAATVNAKSRYVRAGELSTGSGISTLVSGYRNRLYTVRDDVRAFVTCLHESQWVQAGTIPATQDLTATKTAVVRVCNEATGKVYETLTFNAASNRIKPAEWRQDLATYINDNSKYVRAGRAYTDTEIDREKIKTTGHALFYPSTGVNALWVPIGSYLKVVCEVVEWREINRIRSDRAAPGQEIAAYVLDDATDDILERLTFTAAKGRAGGGLWTKDFAASISTRSKYIKAGVLGTDGKFKQEASSYLNRIYTHRSDVRAFTTGLHQDNWVEVGVIPAPKDLKAGDVLTVRVCGPGGRVLEVLNFTLGSSRLKASEWRQDLAKYINKQSRFAKAGRPYTESEVSKETLAKEGHALFYPSTGRNALWVPAGSGLTVELDDWLRESTVPEPIPYSVDVDPLIGNHQTNIALGTLVGNGGQGPSMDLVFSISANRAEFDTPFMFIQYQTDPSNRLEDIEADVYISLPTVGAHRFKRTRANWQDTLVFPSFKVAFNGESSCEVTFQNGSVAVLSIVRTMISRLRGLEPFGTETMWLPTRIKTPLGMGLDLQWVERKLDITVRQREPLEIKGEVKHYPILSLIKSISDDSGNVLLSADFKESSGALTLYPNDAVHKVKYSIEFEARDAAVALEDVFSGGPGCYASARVKQISAVRASSLQSTLSFGYSGSNRSVTCLQSGREDVLTVDGDGKVSVHSCTPATGLPCTNTSYAFEASVDAKTKKVTSRTTSVEQRVGEELRKEKFAFDGDNQLTQHSSSQGGAMTVVKMTRTKDSKTSATTVKAEVTYSKGGKSRSETSVSTFDRVGNLIKRTEKGVTSEWTYFSGEPTVKRDEAKKTRLDAQAPGLSLIFGWALDFANPIGWGLNIFADKGLTWGTKYEYEVKLLPGKYSGTKAAFGLPLAVSYPGDPNFFTWHVESERVYTEVDGKRVDLRWCFYGYGTVPVKGGSSDHPAVVPTLKLTLLDPTSADGKKADSYKAGEVEKLEYVSDVASTVSHGCVSKVTTWLLDENGAEIGDSKDVTTHAYKDLGGNKREVTTTLSTGKVIETTDCISGAPLTTVDRFGNKTTCDFDSLGRLTKITEHDSDKKVLSVVEHRYQAAGRGVFVETHLPEGAPQRVLHDALGRKVKTQFWVSPAIGWRTLSSVDHDALGRESRITESDFALSGRLLSHDVRTMLYDEWGSPSAVRYESDVGQLVSAETDPVSHSLTEWRETGGVATHKRVTSYNDSGSPSTVKLVDAKGVVADDVEYSFTSKGQVKSVKGKHLAKTELEYDHFGRETKQDFGGVVTRSYYPQHIKKAVASKATLYDGYEYTIGTRDIDALGRVTKLVRNERERKYTYTDTDTLKGFLGAANALSTIEPYGPSKHERSYDVHRLCRTEKFKGAAGVELGSLVRYSLQGRPLTFTDAFGHQMHYRYSRRGEYAGVSSDVVYSSLRLDGAGRTLGESIVDKFAGVTVRISYRHDEMGQETERRFVVNGFDDLIMRRTLDGAGRVTRAELASCGKAETILRDESYTYSALGQLATYTCKKGGDAPVTPDDAVVLEQSFTYDSAGLSKYITKTPYFRTAENSLTQYTYRSATQTGKISSAELGSIKGAVDSDVRHDEGGRISVLGNMSMSLTYNRNDQVHEISSKIRADVSSSYGYDEAGRLVSLNGVRYKEDFLYRGEVQYARVRKWVDTALGTRQVALLNESAACYVQQVTSSPAKGAATTKHTLEIKDAHGSLVASYDLSSKAIRYFTYTPYGYRKVAEDDTSWLGFNGEPVDPTLGGIYHLGNGYRVYDPALQRFHAPDDASPFGAGGAGAYRYCMDDPVNNIDPSGAVVIGREYEYSNSVLSDRLANEIFMGIVGIAVGIVSGGAGLGLAGAAFGGAAGAASAGLGLGAHFTESSNPDVSTALRFLSFAVAFEGTFGSIGGVGRGAVGGAVRGSRGGLQPMAAKGGGVQGSINNILKPGGKQLGQLYVGGNNSTKLVIEAHGTTRLLGGRIQLPHNMTMEFNTRHGTKLMSGWEGLENRMQAPALRPRVGKVDSPDYLLGNVNSQWWQKVNTPGHILQDLPGYFRRIAVNNNVDLLKITGNTKLSEVFDWLKSQNTYHYSVVSGDFCRGPLNSRLSQRWLRVARRLALHYAL